MIKSENEIQARYKGFSEKLITSAVILAIMLPSIPASYANLEEDETNSIRVYPKSFNSQKKGVNTFIAPESLNVEYLDVNLSQKKLTVFQTDKEPQEISPAFHPSAFPWQLSHEKMENFLNSQSFLLKQLDDGEYKLNMHAQGFGGVWPLIILAAPCVAPYVPTAMQIAQNALNSPAPYHTVTKVINKMKGKKGK